MTDADGGTGDGAIEDILGFLFAPASRERWFSPDPGFDAEIARRFAPMVEDAAAGRLAVWAATPRGAVALCLLLDQFPRNLYRGTPRAFAGDARAREVARGALAAGHDQGLPDEQRHFLYLPFEHSEDLEDQERSVAAIATLHDPTWRDHAVRHRDIIARFGRFPHRNAILGRPSTPEEEAFLREPGSSF